jgi:hypothetical protein
VTFAAVYAAGHWRPIRHCPGRHVADGPSGSTPLELAGPGGNVQVFLVERAPDPVHVVVLSDGGLISYRKADGRFLHTLNTAEGFERKLQQLGIRLGATPAASSRLAHD